MQISVTDVRGRYQFPIGNVVRLQAQDNYTVLHFWIGQPFVVCKVLKVYEALLAPYGFVRTHRSHLVNREYVKAIEYNTIVMQDNSTAELAKRKKAKIRKQIFHHSINLQKCSK